MGMKNLLSDLNYPEAPEVEPVFIFKFSFYRITCCFKGGESCRNLDLQKEPVADFFLNTITELNN